MPFANVIDEFDDDSTMPPVVAVMPPPAIVTPAPAVTVSVALPFMDKYPVNRDTAPTVTVPLLAVIAPEITAPDTNDNAPPPTLTDDAIGDEDV